MSVADVARIRRENEVTNKRELDAECESKFRKIIKKAINEPMLLIHHWHIRQILKINQSKVTFAEKANVFKNCNGWSFHERKNECIDSAINKELYFMRQASIPISVKAMTHFVDDRNFSDSV
nr:7842_t:CDS:2 [Entrophospora candida]